MLRILTLFALVLATSACAPDAIDSPRPHVEPSVIVGERIEMAIDSSASNSTSTVQSEPANTARQALTPGGPSADDATAINHALRRAGEGTTVELAAGTFYLRSEIAMQSGITLAGVGPETVLVDLRGGDEKVVMFYEDHDAALQNLTIRSDADTAMDDLVMVMNSDRVILLGLTLRRFERNAVYVAGSEQVDISRLDIADATRLDGGEGYGVHLTKRTAHSTVANSTFGPPLRHGIVIQRGSHDNRIEGNIITRPTHDGIDLHGSGEHDNVIVRNTVTESGSAGIGVGETDRAAGTGNVLEDNTLRRNKWGVILHGASAGTVVSANTISASIDHGIYVKDAPRTSLLNNTISDTRRYWGIRVQDGAESLIEGNRLRGNAKPIDAGDSAGVIVRDNTIE